MSPCQGHSGQSKPEKYIFTTRVKSKIDMVLKEKI